MNKKLRRSLWGLQWIFLKQEKPTTKTSTRKSINLSAIENSVASDIEDFPEISMLKFDDFEIPSVNVNSASTKEKYKMSHIEDLPNLSYKNPHILLGNTEEADKFDTKKSKDKSDTKPIRHKSIQIRRVVFPARVMTRDRKPESVNSTTRRKNYGRWFLPPEKWRDSLDAFVNTN
jgi:hypothetical protein